MIRITSALTILALAGCARSEEASLVPPDSNQGYNQVGTVGMPTDDDREPAIGQWRASLQDNAEALEFGPMGTDALFSLLCNGNRGVVLQLRGGAPAGPMPSMTVARGQASQRLPVTPGGGAIPMLRAEVPLQSPLAELLAAGGEPLLISLDDAAPLVLPPSPLIGDYLRSCATAQPLASGAGTGNTQAGNSAAAAPQATGNTAAPAANTAQPKQ